MIKIYDLKKNSFFLLKDSFSNEYLKNKGVIAVENPFKADVLISPSSYFRTYKLSRLIFPHKKHMVWCNEPRFDYTAAGFKNSRSVIMTIFSGDVFVHNLHFLGSYHSNFENNLGIDLFSEYKVPMTIEYLEQKKKFCAAVFMYQNPKSSKLILNGENIDLRVKRQEIALHIYEHGKMDIVGGNWPAKVKVIESSGFDSGNADWWTPKINLLSNYRFNLCYENTISPNYCTEKIWHAITSGCMPIYYGKGTNIYKTFPRNSFIDGSEFGTACELLTFLENITPEEHVARYNICLDVMQQSITKRLQNPRLKTDVADLFIENIYKLTSSSQNK